MRLYVTINFFYKTILTILLKKQMKSTAHTILLQSQASGSQTQHWLPMVTMSMYKLWYTATVWSWTFGTYEHCYFFKSITLYPQYLCNFVTKFNYFNGM